MPESYSDTTVRCFRPRYLSAAKTGRLAEKIRSGLAALEECWLCPRSCGVNRHQEAGGTCRTGRYALVSSAFPHFGEEACLTGLRGSGTIFFASCNLRCVFCQNWDISHACRGRELRPDELAHLMLQLQDLGCHNINFVTPSHVVVQILEALPIAIEMGLQVPLVYNTSGYDSQTSLSLLDGIIDIYMPDFKFRSPASARRYLKAPDYVRTVQQNLRIMHRQVGNLQTGPYGIARQGLLLRHLVMPEHTRDSQRIYDFIARELSPDTAVNIMFQYHPSGLVRDGKYPELNRSLTGRERSRAVRSARTAGLRNLL